MIPLLRELDRDNRSYTIICDKNAVWDRLHRAGRLDFDLVSSHYTSFYSFDLVDRVRGDGFPTAQEFYDYQHQYFLQYQDKIEDDYVTQIRNLADHSVVTTRGGRQYSARQLVIATGYRRRVLNELTEFDFDVTGKTIVFDTIGDSANLMISKLVPGNNRIICVHNGFVPVDKIMSLGGVTFTLDQLEFHNFGFHFRRTYRNLVGGGFCSMNVIRSVLAKALQVTFLAPLFCRYNFPTRFGLVREHDLTQIPSTPLPNGVITLKYWPIDKYAEEFADDLDGAIRQGYLLNDIAFFGVSRLVEFRSRQNVIVDRNKQLLSGPGEEIHYDYLIEADREQPNLPPITVERDGVETVYEYRYRDNYYGVVPKTLNNIYLLGLTRPTTGGLANITEMQGLLTHKLLTNADYRRQITDSLPERLNDYNRTHYMQRDPSKTDHLVWYGSYTEEIARLLGINLEVRQCRSLKALNQYFFLPNNAFKYRQIGEYKVEGCDKLVDRVYEDHRRYSIIHNFVLCFLMYRLLFFEYSMLLFLEDRIDGLAFALILALQLLFAKLFVIPAQNYFGAFKVTYLAAMGAAMVIYGSKLFLPLLLLDFGYTYYVRRRGFRHMFNDLKNKKNYRGFFRRYLAAYARVRSGDGTV